MIISDKSRTLNRPGADSLNDTTNKQLGWFSGIRTKISQINMPEWLSQLGIGSTERPSSSTYENASNYATETKEDRSSQNYVDEKIDYFNEFEEVKEENNSETQFGDSHFGQWMWNDADYCDTLALQHFGPLRNLLTGCNHPGKGHEFISVSIAQPTWCDKCGDFMWGFLTRAVKCDNCSYTCHEKCKSLVTLDCRTADSSLNSCQDHSVLTIYPNLKKFDDADIVVKKESKEESNGFVQIHMNITRPINVVSGDSLSFLDATSQSDLLSAKSQRTITTFFLPRNTVKNVNVSSKMTTRQMIITLLRKFRVADNPRKFALYQRTCIASEDGEQKYKLNRITDDSYPLEIVRSWEEKGEDSHLVLQENDTGDILWDMFEVPELENFLNILNDEEKQYSDKIRYKYQIYGYCLDQNIQSRGFVGGNDELSREKNPCKATDV